MIKPYVTLISEMTVDGKLTLKRGLSSKIIMGLMDLESQKFLHKKRTEFDAIMVGSNTIKIDNSILTNRLVDGKSPIRVVPCSDASIPLDSNVLNRDAPTIIVVSRRADAQKVQMIREKGADVMVCGDDRVDLSLMMERLVERGIKRLMVEGGPTLIWLLIQRRMIDHIVLIQIPYIIGGDSTPSLVGGPGVDSIDQVVSTRLTDFYKVGNHLITEYDVIYNSK
ncbi:riboflavin-specific deaminase C-terminal domain protein [Methanocella conradii HZ254]|uniref:Riboflavin-specific deaminase C-terminal domain protein n=1 Tax=Methanocella conradii (strain DSM 24694 / JCM 17849 / CGMCC 1.5162 / HZ254) TaxID=1041930 RepID=H8I652_METCZ|nr:dihydrofolate reductase family protein [Methanocella conradii]AFD00699.1 riboflavin-specific deaminase C-terminal domain protein [Methanocella conradii HZ254]